jgi:hypothetical protein
LRTVDCIAHVGQRQLVESRPLVEIGDDRRRFSRLY